MAQYLILIHSDEAAWAGVSREEGQQMMKEWEVFGERHADVIRGGNALHPTATATSIRRDADGAFTVTDGPWAETKEALGGYYLIDVADLDEAIAVAKDVPAEGTEVRPVMVFG